MYSSNHAAQGGHDDHNIPAAAQEGRGPGTKPRPGRSGRDARAHGRPRPVRLTAALGLLAGGLGGANTVLTVRALSAGAATLSPACSSGTCTLTFNESGSAVSWDVPDGVSSLGITLFGADGASAKVGLAGDGQGAGGQGAEVQASLAIGQGTALSVNVGGAGALHSGGYNGGGLGEDNSGGGGGATDLSEGTTPLLVAGGGGGGGYTGELSSDRAIAVDGGPGGNADEPGLPGGSVRAYGATLDGGGGGKAGIFPGGAGGVGGALVNTSLCSSDGHTGASGGRAGAAGSPGTGGGGMAGAGGGGGGGYYGGGQGGGPAEDICFDAGGYGGGGGGSSYTYGPGVASGATVDDSPTLRASQLSGNGEAVISYTDPVRTGAPTFGDVGGDLTVPGSVGLLSLAGGDTSGPAGDTLAVSLPSTTTAEGGTVALDADGDGGFTYTPPPGGLKGTDTFTYNVTDTSDGSGDYATGTASIVEVAPLKVANGPTLHQAQYGGSYQTTLGVTGGSGPYHWSVSGGSLPDGLSLSSAGVISGTPSAAGSASFTIEVADSTTPELSATEALSLDVSRAPLTITPDDETMTSGGAVPAFAVSYSGFVNGDDASVVSGLGCAAVDSNDDPVSSATPPGTYTITCSGASAANYAISYGTGTLTIESAETAGTPGGGSTTTTLAGTAGTTTTTAPTEAGATTTTTNNPSGGSTAGTSTKVATTGGSTTGQTATTGATAMASSATTTTTAPTTTTGTPPTTTATPPTTTGTTAGPAHGLSSVVTTTSLRSSADPAAMGSSVTYTALVSPPPGFGTVSFSDDGTVPAGCGAVPVSAFTGEASCSVSYGSAGTRSVVASFSGWGGYFRASSSSALAEAVEVPFPSAGTSYPNGALVSFSGSVYALAGGRAFPTSASTLGALEKVDHAQVVAAPSGAVPPVKAVPRAGTLLSTEAATGEPTVYVVAKGGELYGFARPGQLLSGGFDPDLVVSVPGLGGLKVSPQSAGAAGLTAPSTASDGALVRSRDGYYVWAGGRAFAVPATELGAIRASDPAEVVPAQVSAAQASAPVAGGALLSVVEGGGVFVSYQSGAYAFKTMAQLEHDGYGGTVAVPVPGTGGLPVVSAYLGD